MNQLRHVFKKISLLLVVSILLPACATIISKSTYPLYIQTEPSDAKISITDKKGLEVYSGNTPANVSLEAGAGFFSKAEYALKIQKEGYEDKMIPITFKLDGWYFGNIFIGGLLGLLIIDPATGAMWKIESGSIHETLFANTASTSPQMKVLDVNDIPEDWKTHLVKVN